MAALLTILAQADGGSSVEDTLLGMAVVAFIGYVIYSFVKGRRGKADD